MSGFVVQGPKSDYRDSSGLKNRLYPLYYYIKFFQNPKILQISYEFLYYYNKFLFTSQITCTTGTLLWWDAIFGWCFFFLSEICVDSHGIVDLLLSCSFLGHKVKISIVLNSRLAPCLVPKIKIPKKNSGTCMET